MLKLEFQRASSPCTTCCFGFIPVACPVVIGIFVIVFFVVKTALNIVKQGLLFGAFSPAAAR